MKLIEPSIEILEQQPGIQGTYDMIELCGKTSYKSPVKGGKVAEDFVSARVNEGHYAVLEFGTVYLKYPADKHFVKYHENPYSRIHLMEDGDFAVTTNLRVLVENGWTLDLEYWCEPTEYHARRHTIKATGSIHVYKDLTRHRTMSFCIESTRYCNYTLEKKFDRSIKFLTPVWLKPEETDEFQEDCKALENIYFKWVEKHGWQPQQAAEFLCQVTAADFCICGFEEDWQHLFGLRYYGITGKPHPEVLRIATMCYNAFKEKGIQF